MANPSSRSRIYGPREQYSPEELCEKLAAFNKAVIELDGPPPEVMAEQAKSGAATTDREFNSDLPPA